MTSEPAKASNAPAPDLILKHATGSDKVAARLIVDLDAAGRIVSFYFEANDPRTMSSQAEAAKVAYLLGRQQLTTDH